MILSVAAVAACAPARPGDPFSRPDVRSTNLRIDVRNLNREDVVLYAMSATGKHRLGVVAPEHHGVFSFGWERPAELRVRVEILAGRGYTTNGVNVAPGDRVEVVVPENARRSYLIRP